VDSKALSQYRVFAFCDDCAEVHLVDTITLSLNGASPAVFISAGDASLQKDVAPVVAQLKHRDYQCPKRGKTFRQKNSRCIFLLPVEQTPKCGPC
jgi:hypothetical protein